MFVEFYRKFPQEGTEYDVIKMIHDALECAKKEYKEHEDGTDHIKYMAKAYRMLTAYFEEKQIHPDHY